MAEDRRLETCRLMADPAITIGGYVEIGFPGSGNAIVAGPADIITTDQLVVETGTGKGAGVMAHRAILGCHDVADIHACCRTGTIGYMTGRAVIHDAGMIEYGRLEAAAGGVTDAAILVCRNVVEVHAFSGTAAIGDMAGIAACIQHGRVIMVDERVGKTDRVVTQGAVGRGDRVRWAGRLGPGANGSDAGKVAVVAGDAIAGDALVRKHRRLREPANGIGMANSAILRRRHVAGILDQHGAGIARQRQEASDMTAFAALADSKMNIIPEMRGL